MTPEGKVKQAVVKILKKYDAYYFFPATGGYGKSGVPDIIVCFKGRFIAIECKTDGNRPTELQMKNLTAIMVCGGIAMVIDETNVDEVDALLGLIEKS